MPAKWFFALLPLIATSTLTARAAIFHYGATLTGDGESSSTGSGSALVDVDTVANTMHVHVTFSGLTSGTTASHIHAPTASPGTGTAGEAAWREGFNAVLIEREVEYQADIARRMDLAVKPKKRAAVAKSKNRIMGAEGTPLFGEAAE